MKIWLVFFSVLSTVTSTEAAVLAVAAGRHTCALLSGGAIKCWGKNNFGQLGDGTTTSNSSTPVDVSGITTATSIGVGGFHTCALLSDGEIKCWGHNNFGQLGDGTTTGSITPVDVSGITTATSLALGESHSCALLSGGAIKCWGIHDSGQLGDGTTTGNSATPVDVSGITTATSIALGTERSCALLSGGAIKCWGERGLVGSTPVDVSGITTATSIALGSTNSHSCALLSGGAIKCWGYNDSSQLGDGTTTDSATPVDVSGITTATSIALGYGHSCALLSGGTIKCWGFNKRGQLGDGTTTDSATPVDVIGFYAPPPSSPANTTELVLDDAAGLTGILMALLATTFNMLFSL